MSEGVELLTSNLKRPRPRGAIIRRPRLLARFGDPPPEVVLVSAPAGFGKTTLVLDWLSQQSLLHTWVSLDSLVSDGVRFLAYLQAAIQQVEPGFEIENLPGPAARAITSPTGLASFVNAIARLPNELILVLDDYHAVESDEVHHILRFLAEHVPPNLHLVLISRVDPPLPVSRMRVRQTLVDVRERDLKFRLEEVRAFFQARLNEILTEGQLETLTKRTEGWAAALQLAALSLAGSGDARATIESFAGTQRLIVDYLLDEVFGQQDESMKDFLLSTSILSKFNVELCARVTGQENAIDTLRHAEQAQLFLTPLDSPIGWFRYHQLFAELLAHRLCQTVPERVDLLHERASSWYEEHGYLPEAFHHARKMVAPARLLELLDRHCFDLLKRADLANFSRWTRSFSLEQLAPYPRLVTALAWLRLLTTRTPDLDLLLDLAEETLQRTDLPYEESDRAELRAQAETARAFQLRFADRLSESVSATKNAIGTAQPRDTLIRGLLLFNLARNYMRLGEMALASDALEESIRANEISGNAYLFLESEGHAGAVLIQTSGVPAAAVRLERAASEMTAAGYGEVPAFGIILSHLGRVHLLANRLDLAEQHLERAVQLGAEGNEPDVHGNALVVRAAVHLARRQYDEGRSVLEDLCSVVRIRGIRPFETRVDVELSRLALYEGDLSYVRTWLEQYREEWEAYRVDHEAAALLAAQACVHLGEYERARSLAMRLRCEADSRGRGLIRLQADLVLCITDPRAATHEPWLQVLEASMRREYVLPILDWGELVEPHLEYASARAPSMEVRDFALAQLAALHGGEVTKRGLPAFLQPLEEPLTSREQEVLYHAARSMSNREIADRLFVSVDTVKTHLKHVYAKLNATDRQDAVRRARNAGVMAESPLLPPKG